MINIEKIIYTAQKVELFLACLVEVHLSTMIFPWFKEGLLKNHEITKDNINK